MYIACVLYVYTQPCVCQITSCIVVFILVLCYAYPHFDFRAQENAGHNIKLKSEAGNAEQNHLVIIFIQLKKSKLYENVIKNT